MNNSAPATVLIPLLPFLPLIRRKQFLTLFTSHFPDFQYLIVYKKDPTCHGEMEAIRDACRNLDTFDLSGCDLYTTAEPCPMCLGAALWANIRVIYYGCSREDPFPPSNGPPSKNPS